MKLSAEQLLTIRNNAAFWAEQFPVAMVLDSNEATHAMGLGKYELVLAAGVMKEIEAGEHAFEALQQFQRNNPSSWMFGWFTYDLKNQIEHLTSNHDDGIGFAPLYFFIPQKLVIVDRELTVLEGEEWIPEISGFVPQGFAHKSVNLKARVTKETYLQNVEHIRNHIVEGDVYELNYCVEFYAQNVSVDAATVYHHLKTRSAAPFGGFVKHHQRYMMGASPERFLTKIGNKVYSQPIKGTSKRASQPDEDQQQALQLLNSEKERAENLMIVDLVRNDLAHSAVTGSVRVEELFGIYSFSQVHQMISTVSATIKPGVSELDVIRNAFPMGSMTGAPKIMVMKLIEQYEQTKRGLYSGAIGYFSPEGDFDLNVVIRSIQYNAQSGYLNYEVGGAITYDSVAEAEYDECLLKAKAMQEVLSEL